jgi:hypothetical protein
MSETQKTAGPGAPPPPEPREEWPESAAHPAATGQPPAGTTYAPHDRVPQADGEQEC